MKLGKKLGLFVLILLILAGIIVVALKGFNVSLMSRQHESIDIVIGKEFEINDVKEICKNVFTNKQVVVRVVEVFSDSININVESITDEEKQKLVSAMNEKYVLELTSENITINTISNIRIRDMVVPYIIPGFVSMFLITLYLIIRFRKVNVVKLLVKLYGLLIVTLAALASIVAILRIPFSSLVVNLMAVVCVIELIYFTAKMEKNYDSMILETSKHIK